MRILIPFAIMTILSLSCSNVAVQEDKAGSNLDIEPKEAVLPDAKEENETRSNPAVPVDKEKKNKSSSTEGQGTNKAGKQPSIVFEDPRFNFGEILHGDKVQHDFVFTNQGDRDLEIKNVRVSCGCTKPSYPFLAVPPGGEGKIGVTYNSVGKKGYQRPTIRVFTNDPEQPEVVLRLTGRVKVLPKEEYEKIKQERKANEPE